MSELQNSIFILPQLRLFDAFKIISLSCKILCNSPKLFISITTLTIVPLSLLLLSLAILSHPLKTQISLKQALALVVPTRLESLHVSSEARTDAVSLVRLKAAFFVPGYALSLVAAITSVNSTALLYAGKFPTYQTAVNAVRMAWKRPLITSIYVFVLMWAYHHLARVVSWMVVERVRLVVEVLGTVLKVYLMAVLCMGMVVSVLEERFGWEAVNVGWGLMAGRRFCGWIFAGITVLLSSGIGWACDKLLIDGKGAVDLGHGLEWVVLICMFCSVILWSYVVDTVLYCESRKCRVVNDSDVEFVERHAVDM